MIVLRRIFKPDESPENVTPPVPASSAHQPPVSTINTTAVVRPEEKLPTGFVYKPPKIEVKAHPVTRKVPTFELKSLKEGVVYISSVAKKKLDAYIRHCDYEISGLGIVDVHEDIITVEDVFIIKQSCTSGSTDIDDDAVAEFLAQNIDWIDKMKLWWHSHCNMATFWSGTDTGTIEKFSNNWMLSIVGNKKGEYRCRIDIYDPFRITIDEIPMKYVHVEDDFDERIKAEVKEKVSATQFTTYAYGGNKSSYPTKSYYDAYGQKLAESWRMGESRANSTV